MGTIAQKLTYTAEAVADIKNAVKSHNPDYTGSGTLKDVATAINNIPALRGGYPKDVYYSDTFIDSISSSQKINMGDNTLVLAINSSGVWEVYLDGTTKKFTLCGGTAYTGSTLTVFQIIFVRRNAVLLTYSPKRSNGYYGHIYCRLFYVSAKDTIAASTETTVTIAASGGSRYNYFYLTQDLRNNLSFREILDTYVDASTNTANNIYLSTVRVNMEGSSKLAITAFTTSTTPFLTNYNTWLKGVVNKKNLCKSIFYYESSTTGGAVTKSGFYFMDGYGSTAADITDISYLDVSTKHLGYLDGTDIIVSIKQNDNKIYFFSYNPITKEYFTHTVTTSKNFTSNYDYAYLKNNCIIVPPDGRLVEIKLKNGDHFNGTFDCDIVEAKFTPHKTSLEVNNRDQSDVGTFSNFMCNVGAI